MSRLQGAGTLVLVILLITSLAGTASASTPAELELPAGSFVSEGGPELRAKIPALNRDTAICLRGTGTAAAVYWSTQAPCGPLAPGDVRLTNAGGRSAGTPIEDGDEDAGAETITPEGLFFSFLDADESEGYNFGDTAYLAYCETSECTIEPVVRPGWIRIAGGPYPAGSRVAPGEDDVDKETLQTTSQFTDPLARRNAHVRYLDLDGDDAYGPTDALYWRAAGRSNDAAHGWIRLTPAPGGTAPETLAPGAREIAPGTLKSLTAVVFCHLDLEADGNLSYDDPVYLVPGSACPEYLPPHALRITATSSHPAGSYVGVSDWDRLEPLHAINGTGIVYVDRDDTKSYTNRDAIYLLICETPGCGDEWKVTLSTIRLTATEDGPAGARPASTDGDYFARVRRDTPAFEAPFAAGRFAFWSANSGKSLSGGDVLYWRPGALTDKTPVLGTLRVSAFTNGTGMGGLIDAASPEATAALKATDPKPKALCYADGSGSGGYEPGDPLYVVTGSCLDDVGPGAIRLVTTLGRPAGTIVTAGESDVGRLLHNATEFAGFYSIRAGSPGATETHEAIYICLHTDGCPQGEARTVEAGWLRLSSSAGGAALTTVRADDGDVGREAKDPSFLTKAATRKNLTAILENQWVYWDLDASDTLSTGDLVYLRMKGEVARPAIGDLRLTTARMGMPASWFPQLVSGELLDDPDLPRPRPRGGAEDDAVTPDAGDDPDEEIVPGVLPVLVVAVTTVLAAGVRRRRGRA